MIFLLLGSPWFHAWIWIVLWNLSYTLIQITAAECLQSRVIESTHRCRVPLLTLLLLPDILPLLVLCGIHLEVQCSKYVLCPLRMQRESFFIWRPRGVLLLDYITIKLIVIIASSSSLLLARGLISLLVVNELVTLRELLIEELHLHYFVMTWSWVAAATLLVVRSGPRLCIMYLYAHRTLTVARRVHYVASLENHFRILLLFHILSHGRYHRDPSINSSFTNFAQIIVGEVCGCQI